MSGIDEIISSYSFLVTGYAILLLLGLSLLSLRIKHLSKLMKRLLFGSIVAVTLVPTFFLAGSTIYLNTISSSGGPVHWHADFEIWKCGQEVELLDPTGLSNKVGTSVLHEHNDKRIHLEGVVVKPADASLGKFFHVVGGKLDKDIAIIPSHGGNVILEAQACNEIIPYAQLQVFVFKTDHAGYYSQEKLTNPADYIISPFGTVPSGDCIIVELDSPKERTERLCQSYKAAIQTGKLKGERL